MAQTARTPRNTAKTGQGPKDDAKGPRPVPPREDAATSPGEHPVCTVALCPICAVVTTVGQLRPEVLQHLLAAGREFLLAARAVVDVRVDDIAEGEGEQVRVEKIEIA